MGEKLKSRKLWLAILGSVVGIIYPPAAPLLKIIIPTYLGAQGVADAAAAFKK